MALRRLEVEARPRLQADRSRQPIDLELARRVRLDRVAQVLEGVAPIVAAAKVRVRPRHRRQHRRLVNILRRDRRKVRRRHRRLVHVRHVDRERRGSCVRIAANRRIVHGHLYRVGLLCLEIQYPRPQPEFAPHNLEGTSIRPGQS